MARPFETVRKLTFPATQQGATASMFNDLKMVEVAGVEIESEALVLEAEKT